MSRDSQQSENKNRMLDSTKKNLKNLHTYVIINEAFSESPFRRRSKTLKRAYFHRSTAGYFSNMPVQLMLFIRSVALDLFILNNFSGILHSFPARLFLNRSYVLKISNAFQNNVYQKSLMTVIIIRNAFRCVRY